MLQKIEYNPTFEVPHYSDGLQKLIGQIIEQKDNNLYDALKQRVNIYTDSVLSDAEFTEFCKLNVTRAVMGNNEFHFYVNFGMESQHLLLIEKWGFVMDKFGKSEFNVTYNF